MKNKFQEALDKVKSVPLFIEPKPDRNGWTIYLEVSSIEEKNKTDIDVLQELVDKATPKKPNNIIYNNFGMGERIGRCPNCGILVSQFQSHCECDQKLDWIKDE